MLGFIGGQRVGIEVGQKILRAAGVRKSSGKRHADWLCEVGLPHGLMFNSFTEPNISDVPAFVDALKKLMHLSGHGAGRVGVALPDYVCRVSVLEFDSIQAKKDETEQMIRWRLKKVLPFDVESAALRYQYLGRFRSRDKDQHRMLVSIIKNDILLQYEDALKQAGLKPERLGISSFSIWNLFQEFIAGDSAGSDCFALMNISGNRLTLMIFDGGVPHFFRLKDMGGGLEDGDNGIRDTMRVLRELSASITFYKENYGEKQVDRVYITGDAKGLDEVAAEASRNSAMKASVLDMEKALVRGGSITGDAGTVLAFGAACGAATEG